MRTVYSYFLALLILWFAQGQVQSAYIRAIPVKVVQPGGDTLRCFASGDEHYNWLHDAQGYTIMRNTLTGYYEYVTLKQQTLVCTGVIAGRADPASLGIPRYALASPMKRELIRSRALAKQASAATAPTIGTFQNLVVFVRFSDQPEFTDPLSYYSELYNGTSSSSTSVLKYYQEVSYNQLTINSLFYPAPAQGNIVSYQDSHPQAYYQPYDAANNPTGYLDADRTAREDSLLMSAVNGVKAQVPDSLNIDANSDGYIDNISFIIEGGTSAWASLLWPHQGWLPGGVVRGKATGSYDLQIQDFIALEGSSVLCHEMFHTLGAPDLYHYSYDGMEPVGSWDLMSYNTSPPQHMGAYMKFRYGHWIHALPEISAHGTYTLQPLQSPAGNCYMIRSQGSANEYYVVEYRKPGGIFETQIPGNGLLVYRINTLADGQGNGGGPPDEVYIYRQGGTDSVDGDYATADFSAASGRTQLNDHTDPSGFLSDGSPGGLDISGIGSAGSTISFTLNGPLPITISLFKGTIAVNGSVNLSWRTLSEAGNYGFSVQRATGKDTLFTELPGSFVPGHGTTIQPQDYQWTDLSAPAPPLRYRLRQINLDGSSQYLSPLVIDNTSAAPPAPAPWVFALRQNYPNPFNPATTIEFTVARPGKATVTVYNGLGQIVGMLFDGIAVPGQVYRSKFDGTNLASGMYIYMLNSGGAVESRRLLLLR
jgi:M6 family metalloprotease-like protein